LIIGILPGLRFTRHDLHLALQREGSAKSGLRFGGFWTAAIVVQVAVTVALIPIAGGGASLSNRFERRATALNAERYLAAIFNLEPETPARDSSEATAFVTRRKATYLAIEERLLADPDVEAVAFAERLPGQDQFKYFIAVDAEAASASAIRAVTSNSVSPGFFAAFGAPVLAGRGFNLGDEPQRGVIVNESFVRHVLEGRSAIGQRLRFPEGRNGTVNPDQWFEIVGVTQDIGSHASEESRVEASAVYFPMTAGETGRANMTVRVRGNVNAVAQRLRRIATEADPTLRVGNVIPLIRVNDGEARINWVLTSVISAVSIMTLLLSATGIHAIMAFAVTRRMREIGIRTALGAQPRQIVWEVFTRAFLQLALGVVAGVGLAILFIRVQGDFILSASLLLTAAGVMLTAGLVASAAPLRRALRVDPTEALRREG
jgi:hypothetical protein